MPLRSSCQSVKYRAASIMASKKQKYLKGMTQKKRDALKKFSARCSNFLLIRTLEPPSYCGCLDFAQHLLKNLNCSASTTEYIYSNCVPKCLPLKRGLLKSHENNWSKNWATFAIGTKNSSIIMNWEQLLMLCRIISHRFQFHPLCIHSESNPCLC